MSNAKISWSKTNNKEKKKTCQEHIIMKDHAGMQWALLLRKALTVLWSALQVICIALLMEILLLTRGMIFVVIRSVLSVIFYEKGCL